MIIAIIVFTVSAVLCILHEANNYSDAALIGGILTGSIAFGLLVGVIVLGVSAKQNKALMKAHLENPTYYTYSQIAEHNELVTKAKVFQGTIFSFYNDVDLQTIDIDNVSQKVIIEPKDK